MPDFSMPAMPAPDSSNAGRRVSQIRQSVVHNGGRRPSSWIELSEAEDKVSQAAYDAGLEGMDLGTSTLEVVHEQEDETPPPRAPKVDFKAVEADVTPPANADIEWFRQRYSAAQKELIRLREALQASESSLAETIEWQQQREKSLSSELQAALGGNAAQKYSDYVGQLGANAVSIISSIALSSISVTGAFY
jgi:hypothetical protein